MGNTRRPGIGGIVDGAAANLHPAYFALVMATGIVSIACKLQDILLPALILFALNIVAYATLWLLTLYRLIVYPRLVVSDLIDHTRGPGFFTIVAATGVLGSQCILVIQNYMAATCLGVLSFVLWLGLVYSIFAGLIVKQDKPTIAEGIHGGWLVSVVATQSVAVVTALLAPHFPQSTHPLLFLTLALWLFGGMLYIWLISLIVYRYLFFAFSPQDLSPPYWINMGAVAISALAGTALIANAPAWSFLEGLLPFLQGFTLFFWSTGTWWIPILVILGFWRHGYKKLPIAYNPLYWGAVFPLGMYTASTIRVAEVMDLPFLMAIPRMFLWIAFSAWLLTFAGLVRSLVGALQVPQRARDQNILHKPVAVSSAHEPR